MRKRRLSREYALKMLYQIDITRDTPAEVLQSFWRSQSDMPVSEEVKNFTESLVQGVRKNLSDIDKKISNYATNWNLNRIAVIERNILRIAGFELLYLTEIPPKVSINEAVELAKKYSGQEAAKFVNGVLDKIKAESKK